MSKINIIKLTDKQIDLLCKAATAAYIAGDMTGIERDELLITLRKNA